MKKVNLQNTITYAEIESTITLLQSIEQKLLQANIDKVLYKTDGLGSIYQNKRRATPQEIEYVRRAWHLIHDIYMDPKEEKITC